MADLETLHNRASAALEEGDEERAISLYKEIVAQEPNDELAYSQLMDLYYDRDRIEYYLTRANWNIVQNKLEHAINDCKKAISTDPTNPRPYHKLARLLTVTKKYLKAIDIYNKLIELEPDNYDAYVELTSAYMSENSPDSAIGIAKQGIKKFPEKVDLKNILAKIYFDIDDYKNALEVVQDEILRIKILLQDNQNDIAKANLDKINPNTLSKEQKLTYYTLLSQYFYNEGNSDEALSAVQKYVDTNKANDALSYQMKALIYEKMGDEFTSLLNWSSYSKIRGKLEEAIMHLQNAEQINQNDKNVLIELARLYSETNEKFVSMEYWKRVYELDQDIEAKKILADFYYEQGDIAMAEYYGKETGRNTQKEYAEYEEEDEGLLNKIMNFFSKK